MRILYFLEDRAQEGFIKALVERIARNESLPCDSIIHDIRSARGGSRIINEFKKFLKDSATTITQDVDFVVVAIDGNCKGYNERVKQLEKCIRPDHPFKGKVVYAVPDPHIERWYIMDQRAFKNGVGLDRAPEMPPYKCKKAYYKQVLNKALKDSNVNSLLGGVEFAEKIVDQIENLESFARQNSGCQAFIENLGNFLRRRMGV